MKDNNFNLSHQFYWTNRLLFVFLSLIGGIFFSCETRKQASINQETARIDSVAGQRTSGSIQTPSATAIQINDSMIPIPPSSSLLRKFDVTFKGRRTIYREYKIDLGLDSLKNWLIAKYQSLDSNFYLLPKSSSNSLLNGTVYLCNTPPIKIEIICNDYPDGRHISFYLDAYYDSTAYHPGADVALLFFIPDSNDTITEEMTIDYSCHEGASISYDIARAFLSKSQIRVNKEGFSTAYQCSSIVKVVNIDSLYYWGDVKNQNRGYFIELECDSTVNFSLSEQWFIAFARTIMTGARYGPPLNEVRIIIRDKINKKYTLKQLRQLPY